MLRLNFRSPDLEPGNLVAQTEQRYRIVRCLELPEYPDNGVAESPALVSGVRNSIAYTCLLCCLLDNPVLNMMCIPTATTRMRKTTPPITPPTTVSELERVRDDVGADESPQHDDVAACNV